MTQHKARLPNRRRLSRSPHHSTGALVSSDFTGVNGNFLDQRTVMFRAFSVKSNRYFRLLDSVFCSIMH
jgi:hypothetical protein